MTDPSKDSYRAPSASLEPMLRAPGQAAGPLYSPSAISAHAILFSPAVGGILAAVNYARLGDTARAWRVGLAGFGATAALIALGISLPANSLMLRVALPVGLACGLIWRKGMEPAFVAHIKVGGAKASPWPVFLSCVAVVGAYVALATLSRDH